MPYRLFFDDAPGAEDPSPDVFKTATVEQLQKEVSDRDAAINTLNASVLITATTAAGARAA